jgi:hypothetical protein
VSSFLGRVVFAADESLAISLCGGPCTGWLLRAHPQPLHLPTPSVPRVGGRGRQLCGDAPLLAGEARWARVAAGELGRLTQGGVGNAARYIRAPGEGCSRFLRHGFTRRVLAVSYRHGADPVVWRHARCPIVVCARAVQKIRADKRFRAGCDEIEPGAQRSHVDALECP